MRVCVCVWHQFSGPSCGHHGPYTFYRAFAYRNAATSAASAVQDDGGWKTLSLGEFFIVRISPGSPAAVCELQLIWETSNGLPGQKLASVKLYFLPEHTPAGRQHCHGEVPPLLCFVISLFIIIIIIISFLLVTNKMQFHYTDAVCFFWISQVGQFSLYIFGHAAYWRAAFAIRRSVRLSGLWFIYWYQNILLLHTIGRCLWSLAVVKQVLTSGVSDVGIWKYRISVRYFGIPTHH